MKKETNKLQEQLSIMKGRYEINRKRKIRKDRTLQLEFQKELYWTGTHAHLAAGVKCQYEKLKKGSISLNLEYETKCEENDKLKKKIV